MKAGKQTGFTLIEVMIALGIFFVAVFAILGVVNNVLSNARRLQRDTLDTGRPAAWLSLSNNIEEGLITGDFENDYPGCTWTADIYEFGTNGLYQVDMIVQGPRGTIEGKMSMLVYDPSQKNKSGIRPGFRR